jgi:hypothetical protein
MYNNSIKISILLPTRGRTEQLARSVKSLIATADNSTEIEWLFGFDSDDSTTYQWFEVNVIPDIVASGGTYTCLQFEPLGYERLHEYVNALAAVAEGNWFVFWNDDAVMETAGWDTVINSYTGRFCLQAFDTHNLHPYSIFPIVPKEWFEVVGHLSRHQLNDAWLSQIAWILDIMQRIDVRVNHDRFDLTGNNNDSTYQQRKIFEGNINDSRDFNHVSNRVARFKDATVIAEYLKSQGVDMTRWDDVLAKKVDPWDKMLAADVNNQVSRVDKA